MASSQTIKLKHSNTPLLKLFSLPNPALGRQSNFEFRLHFTCFRLYNFLLLLHQHLLKRHQILMRWCRLTSKGLWLFLFLLNNFNWWLRCNTLDWKIHSYASFSLFCFWRFQNRFRLLSWLLNRRFLLSSPQIIRHLKYLVLPLFLFDFLVSIFDPSV